MVQKRIEEIDNDEQYWKKKAENEKLTPMERLEVELKIEQLVEKEEEHVASSKVTKEGQEMFDWFEMKSSRMVLLISYL